MCHNKQNLKTFLNVFYNNYKRHNTIELIHRGLKYQKLANSACSHLSFPPDSVCPWGYQLPSLLSKTAKETEPVATAHSYPDLEQLVSPSASTPVTCKNV